jgi:hypothetical protein
MEPLCALGIAGVWAAYGAIYFVTAGKKKGKTTMVTSRATA